MNDNYDFYGYESKNNKNEKQDKVERFLEDIFDDSEDEAPICRNIDCKFTDAVLEYLAFEWEIDLGRYSNEIQNKGMDLIDELKGKDNVPNVAARIANEVVPLI